MTHGTKFGAPASSLIPIPIPQRTVGSPQASCAITGMSRIIGGQTRRLDACTVRLARNRANGPPVTPDYFRQQHRGKILKADIAATLLEL